jgi:4-amino-4-deoxy-L-arabinose transferase-like glycosyltransferase
MSEASPIAPTAPAAPARWMLPALLGVHLLFALTYAFLLPLWGAVPDEPLHYSHMKYVAEHWRLPLITVPHRDLREYYFVADPATTAQHGPVFYWVGAVLYRLTDSLTLKQQQYALRLYPVILGGLTVWLAWLAFLLIFSDQPRTAWWAALLLCVMPHRLMVSSVIYLDSMAVLTATLTLYLMVRAVLHDSRLRAWAYVGLGMGLALATKQSSLVLLPALVLCPLILWRMKLSNLPTALARVGGILLGTLLLAGWIYVRNWLVYGTLLATDPGPKPQLNLLETFLSPMASFFWWFVTRGFWLSLWSQVGWLPRAAEVPVYGLLLVTTAVVVVGLVAGLRGRYRGLSPENFALIGVFGFLLLTMYAGALQWVLITPHNNEETGKHAQALLVGLIPLAAAAWRYWLGTRPMVRGLQWSVALMLTFNALAIFNLATNLNPRFTRPDPPYSDWKVKNLPTRGVPGVQHEPDVPGGHQIHDQQSRHPNPQRQPGALTQGAADAHHEQQGQTHHRHQHIPPPGVELHIHGPVGPLVAQKHQAEQQTREVQRHALPVSRAA